MRIVLIFLLTFLTVEPTFAQTLAVGQNNVAIGHVSGGQISIGLTKEEATALFKSNRNAQVDLLRGIIERWNKEIQKSNKVDQISIGAAQTFLETVLNRHLTRKEWPGAFAALIREYLTLGERIRALATVEKLIAKYLEAAEIARLGGDFSRADRELEAAEAELQGESSELSKRVNTNRHNLGVLLYARSKLLLLSGSADKAAETTKRAFDAIAASNGAIALNIDLLLSIYSQASWLGVEQPFAPILFSACNPLARDESKSLRPTEEELKLHLRLLNACAELSLATFHSNHALSYAQAAVETAALVQATPDPDLRYHVGRSLILRGYGWLRTGQNAKALSAAENVASRSASHLRELSNGRDPIENIEKSASRDALAYGLLFSAGQLLHMRAADANGSQMNQLVRGMIGLMTVNALLKKFMDESVAFATQDFLFAFANIYINAGQIDKATSTTITLLKANDVLKKESPQNLRFRLYRIEALSLRAKLLVNLNDSVEAANLIAEAESILRGVDGNTLGAMQKHYYNAMVFSTGAAVAVRDNRIVDGVKYIEDATEQLLKISEGLQSDLLIKRIALELHTTIDALPKVQIIGQLGNRVSRAAKLLSEQK